MQKNDYIRLLKLAPIVAIAAIMVSSSIFTVKKPEVIPCSDEYSHQLVGDLKYISCVKDSNGEVWFLSKKVFKPRLEYSDPIINSKKFPDGVYVDVVSTTNGLVDFRYSGETKGHIQGTGTTIYSRRSVATATFSHKDLKKGVHVYPYPYDGRDIYFKLRPPKIGSALATKILMPSDAYGASKKIIIGIMALLILTCIFSAAKYIKTRKKRWALLALSSSFFLAALNFGRPFRGMGGYIDRGDDTYYVAYAESQLANGDLFSCDTDVSFSKMQHVPCFGLPGTPIMLELGILGRKLLAGDSFYGHITLAKLRAMRVTSAFYGFIATILLFLAFHMIRPGVMAIVLSGGIIWGTSLWKWVFVRSIFTHSPEMALLSAIVLLMVMIQTNRIRVSVGAILIAVLLGMQIFVRGEYLICVLLMPFFFIPYPLRVENIKQLMRSIFSYIVIITPFIIAYRVAAEKIGTYAKGNGALILHSFADLTEQSFYTYLAKNFQEVMTSFWQSGGLPFIGAACLVLLIFKYKVRDRLIIWSSIFVLIFFTVTTLFHTPLGSEWGNRYYLKLYPFFFIYILYFLNYSGALGRFICISAVAGALIRQYQLVETYYTGHEIENYERYKNLLTDMQFHMQGYQHGFYSIYFLAFLMLTFTTCFALLKTFFEGSRFLKFKSQ